MDPYSGEPSWRAEIDGGSGSLACTVEGSPLATERVVVALVRELGKQGVTPVYRETSEFVHARKR